jgi:hypothetical protein
MSVRTRHLFTFGITAACIVCARDAHAGGYGIGGTLWVESTATYMPNSMGGAPTLAVNDITTGARPAINGSTPPLGFATGYFGLRSGIDFVGSDLWILPIIDVGLYGIVGAYADQLTSADGSLFRLHPAGTIMLDAEILGFGVRLKKRRWMFEATLKPGLAVLAVPAAVADGGHFIDIDALNSVTPTLRGSIALCRRLDPQERVCATATANIYQWGWGNGGSLGLRWEFGS